MAKKKQAAKKPAAAKHEDDDDPNFQLGPQPEPVDPFKTLDLENLFESLTEPMYEKFGYRSTAEKLLKEVGAMRAALAIKEAELRHELGPLLKVYESLTSTTGEPDQHYDAPLKRILKGIRIKAKEYGYGPEKPTGAKPWDELQQSGASDEQIAKNLKSIDLTRVDDYFLSGKHSAEFELVMIAGESDISAPILKGKGKVVAEVRRLMGIKQPKKAAAKAPSKKKTPRKKKPAAKKKSSKPATSPRKNKRAGTGRKSTAKKKPSKKATVVDKRTVQARASATRRRKKADVSAGIVKELGLGNKAANNMLDADVCAVLGASIVRLTAAELQPMLSGRPPLHEVYSSIERLKAEGSIDEAEGGLLRFVDVSLVQQPAKKKPAAAPSANGERTLESILAGGAKTSKDIGSLLGISTDAAGALIRRRLKKGEIQRVRIQGATEQHYERAPKTDPNAADDTSLNQAFEKTLSDKGKRRNDRLQREAASGWNVPEAPANEDVAAQEALAEERERSEEVDKMMGRGGSAVVVEAATKRKKGILAGGRKPR